MKIAAWNVNSLRVRLPQVLRWMEQTSPDVLALQELKMETAIFPQAVFQEKGLYTAANGQKTYNGVAIISRFPLSDIETPDYDEQRRIIAATVNGFRIVNVYVPNGEAVGSLKYQYKLKWLAYLKDYLKTQLKQYSKVVVLGDFNIAPHDDDVYDPKAWEGSVLCSLPEREALTEIFALGFLDSFRLFTQKKEQYSWWDYRTFAFKRNRGLRIDHILISDVLEKYCKSSSIDIIPRGWEQPSDHAPVMVEFES